MPTKSLPDAFGKVLREYRERAQLSQRQLAAGADLDRTFIGMLERGERQPTLETLFRLARTLKVAPATLVAKISAELE
jgi:transcriptional regulator with XRE-family HTH domain